MLECDKMILYAQGKLALDLFQFALIGEDLLCMQELHFIMHYVVLLDKINLMYIVSDNPDNQT